MFYTDLTDISNDYWFNWKYYRTHIACNITRNASIQQVFQIILISLHKLIADYINTQSTPFQDMQKISKLYFYQCSNYYHHSTSIHMNTCQHLAIKNFSLDNHTFCNHFVTVFQRLVTELSVWWTAYAMRRFLKWTFSYNPLTTTTTYYVRHFILQL